MTSSSSFEILLVEDNPSDVELTLRALKKNSIANAIAIVRDGEAALDFVFATGSYAARSIDDPPKVILLDLKLPKVDGLEVLHRLKGDPRTKAIPVVMLTSSREEQDIRRSYHYGVNSYIVKPVEFEKFARAIGDIGIYWMVLNQAPFP